MGTNRKQLSKQVLRRVLKSWYNKKNFIKTLEHFWPTYVGKPRRWASIKCDGTNSNITWQSDNNNSEKNLSWTINFKECHFTSSFIERLIESDKRAIRYCRTRYNWPATILLHFLKWSSTSCNTLRLKVVKLQERSLRS